MEIIKYFSGFANVGIGTTYAEKLGFECALANELNLDRADWLQSAYPKAKVVQGDFTDPKIFAHLVEEFKRLQCRAAFFSPCCQPFSKAGGQHLDSPEAFLFLPILDFIEATLPDFAWIENAKEFPSSILADDPRTIEMRIRERLKPLGYDINLVIQDAAHFGTPQHRRRSLFLMSRTGKRWEAPKESKKIKTVRGTIGHLPSVQAGQRSGVPLHNGPKLPKCQADCMIGVKEGEASPNPVNVKGEPPSKPKPPYAFCRILSTDACNTIVQKSASISGYRTVHYRDNRTLTLLEIILLSGLPKDWNIPLQFRCKDQLIRGVIGECFAPRHVAHLLKELRKII